MMDDRDPKLPEGWWILPSIVLGVIIWGLLLWWAF
jgi:hypothetical protein